MKIFPRHALANMHLFRDFYHRSTCRDIGKKGYVQMALYKQDIVFFIEFLRKNKIYAGIIRAELQIIHQIIIDFNKEYNSLTGCGLSFHS